MINNTRNVFLSLLLASLAVFANADEGIVRVTMTTSQGIIEIDRLTDVMYVGRPAYGQPHSTVGIFKLIEGGSHAERVNVRLGKSSVNTIEIQEGLRVGDIVVLTDMSQWDAYDRVRIRGR